MKKLTTNEFIEKSKIVHGKKYDYSKSAYICGHKKIIIMCLIHGDFEQMPYSHLYGKGCPKCSGKNKSIKEIIKEFKNIHGNKYNYSKFKYKGAIIKGKIICPKHGNFFQKPNDHLNKIGCPLCGIELRTKKIKSNIFEFIKKSNKIHNFKYDYSKFNYINNNTKSKIICLVHGEFLQTPHGHLSENGCPKCSHTISKMEQKFLNYLKIPNTKNHRQVYILGKKVDGFDPKTNTIYEFLGDYWHGNLNIYNLNKIHSLIKIKFKTLNKKTFNKLKFLKSYGYKIKYIWENDWKKWNKNKKQKFPIIEY